MATGPDDVRFQRRTGVVGRRQNRRDSPEPDIPLLKRDSKTDGERHQSKVRQQKPGGRVAQLGPSGPGGEFVRAELTAL